MAGYSDAGGEWSMVDVMMKSDDVRNYVAWNRAQTYRADGEKVQLSTVGLKRPRA